VTRAVTTVLAAAGVLAAASGLSGVAAASVIGTVALTGSLAGAAVAAVTVVAVGSRVIGTLITHRAARTSATIIGPGRWSRGRCWS
jgi:hypothetical protein